VKKSRIRRDDQDSTSGNAVMFDAVRGKIVEDGALLPAKQPGVVVSAERDVARVNDISLDIGEDAPDMNLHRGYHSSTTLSDGKIFTIGGSWSGGSNMPKPNSQAWLSLRSGMSPV
jgi:hypothetical protein